MVNYGPSRACKQCKIRRTKCDLGTPTCRRCQIRGLECSGPLNNFDIFRHQTLEHFNKAEPLETETESTSDWSSSSSSSSSDDKSLVQYTPTFTWQDIALTNVAPRIIAETEGFSMLKPWISLVNIAQASTGGNSAYLSTALSAFALQGMAMKIPYVYKDLLNLASKQYGKALVLTNQVLSNSATATTNQCLLGVILLASYAQRSGDVTAHYTHIDGLAQMIKVRGKALLKSQPDRDIFRALRDRLAISYTTRSQTLPFSKGQDDWFFEDSDGSENPWLSLQTVALRIPALRSRTKDLCRTDHTVNMRALTHLRREGADICSKLEQYHTHLPRQWSFLNGSSDDRWSDEDLIAKGGYETLLLLTWYRGLYAHACYASYECLRQTQRHQFTFGEYGQDLDADVASAELRFKTAVNALLLLIPKFLSIQLGEKRESAVTSPINYLLEPLKSVVSSGMLTAPQIWWTNDLLVKLSGSHQEAMNLMQTNLRRFAVLAKTFPVSDLDCEWHDLEPT